MAGPTPRRRPRPIPRPRLIKTSNTPKIDFGKRRSTKNVTRTGCGGCKRR